MAEKKYKNKYRVETNRLKDWDYSSGAYFVTVCTKDRQNYFGEIKNSEMTLSTIGEIAKRYWVEIPAHFPFVELDEYAVMPNHVHGILFLDDKNCDNLMVRHIGCRDAINRVSTTRDNVTYGGVTGVNNPMNKNSLSKIIRWYKGRTTFEIHKLYNPDFQWQSRFYDNVIRDEIALMRIRGYIMNNAVTWKTDSENMIKEKQ